MKQDRTISPEELEKHNDAISCWMAIEGTVYDVTEYIDKHPGGNHILKGCGRDMTESFQGKRTRGIFTKEAEEELQAYRIGVYKKNSSQQ